MEQKIVVHLKDGAIHKGITHDFEPGREMFHLLPAEGGGVPLRVNLENMKALFWVKDYMGNRDFVARRDFAEAVRQDKRAIVTFNDGEQIWGTLGEENEGNTGFFFYPSDQEDNNVRLFVIRSATKELRLVD